MTVKIENWPAEVEWRSLRHF